MMQGTTFLLAVLLSATAFMPGGQAQDFECSKPDDLPQQGMNMCAFKDWEKADAELNALWPGIREHFQKLDETNREFYPDRANGEESLLKAQRAWIDFRDGHCAAEGAQFTGGTIQPLIIHSCRADLTRKRIRQLQALTEEF